MFTSFTQENREDYAKQIYEIAEYHFLSDNERLLNYIYDFAWHYGRLYHIGDVEKIKAAISEKFKLPEEFLNNKFYWPTSTPTESGTDWEKEAKEAWRKIEIYKDEAQRYRTALDESSQPSTGMREALEEIKMLCGKVEFLVAKDIEQICNEVLSTPPENECKWSDSDVKKFLEDYRVANMDMYLNPVIWFDKLNDEK